MSKTLFCTRTALDLTLPFPRKIFKPKFRSRLISRDGPVTELSRSLHLSSEHLVSMQQYPRPYIHHPFYYFFRAKDKNQSIHQLISEYTLLKMMKNTKFYILLFLQDHFENVLN